MPTSGGLETMGYGFPAAITDYNGDTVLLECTQTESRNDDFIALLKRKFENRIEIVRGGSVAVEAVM